MPPTLAPILHADTLPKQSSVDTGDFKGYSLLLVCGKATNCAQGETDNKQYTSLPLSSLKDAFERQGNGVANYLPGYLSADAEAISRGGDAIANTLTLQRLTRIKGVFLVGHSSGGNYVVDGLSKFDGATNNARLVKGVVLIEPDLVDFFRWGFWNHRDNIFEATLLSFKYPTLTVMSKAWLNQGSHRFSIPQRLGFGNQKLEEFFSKEESHLDISNAPDMINAVMDFFQRHKYK